MTVATVPGDTDDTRLLSHTRPPDWANPDPAPRYNLSADQRHAIRDAQDAIRLEIHLRMNTDTSAKQRSGFGR